MVSEFRHLKKSGFVIYAFLNCKLGPSKYNLLSR